MPALDAVLADEKHSMFEHQNPDKPGILSEITNTVPGALNFGFSKKMLAHEEKLAQQQMYSQQAQLTAQQGSRIEDLSQMPALDLSPLYAEIISFEAGEDLEMDTLQRDQKEKAMTDREPGGKERKGREKEALERGEQEKDSREKKARQNEEKKKEEPAKRELDQKKVLEQQQLENNKEPQVRMKQEVTARFSEPKYQDQDSKVTIYETRETVKAKAVEDKGRSSLGKSLGSAGLKKGDSDFAKNAMLRMANITQATNRTVEMTIGSDQLRFEKNPADNMTYAKLNGTQIGPDQTTKWLQEAFKDMSRNAKALWEAGTRHAAINPAQKAFVNLSQAMENHNRTVMAQKTHNTGRTAPAQAK